MHNPGKLFILLGIGLLVIGLWYSYGPKIPFLGKLPGDIMVKKEGFTFYFPLATSLLVSLVLSLMMYLFKK